MDRINVFGFVGSLVVACGFVAFLVTKGHADTLTVAVAAVVSIVLAIMNVIRGKPSNGSAS
jgi:hypothetical protein